jgi:hypothetical protein
VPAVALITTEAVTLVAVGVPTKLPLTPALPDATAVAPERFVPPKVTVIVVPKLPLFGLTEASVGVAALTVNGTDRVFPPTTRPNVVAPVAAPPVIVICADTLLLVGDPTIEPLTPALPEATAVAPERFVPVKVTGNVVPTVPVAGLTAASVGVAEFTTKLTE